MGAEHLPKKNMCVHRLDKATSCFRCLTLYTLITKAGYKSLQTLQVDLFENNFC